MEWAEAEDQVEPLRVIPLDEDAIAAPAFGITQLDADGSILKVRRGDDWKRSHQNEMTQVFDKPDCHHVDYGAKGAVWAYGRVADFLCHIARVCLLCPVWHCVDDFAGIEDYRTAESAFSAFQTLNELHGLKTERKKEQKPATSHRIQGVQFALEKERLLVAPLDDRRKRVADEIR